VSADRCVVAMDRVAMWEYMAWSIECTDCAYDGLHRGGKLRVQRGRGPAWEVQQRVTSASEVVTN